MRSASLDQSYGTPGVVGQPRSADALNRGFREIVAAIQPTLGPIGRRTLVAYPLASKAPETLDNGGSIARRIVGLADPDAAIGTMLLRDALWRLDEEVGDGTATAAVLFLELFQQGRRLVAAGAEPFKLRRDLEHGLQFALRAIDTQTQPLSGRERLVGLAHATCSDRELAELLGEVFEVIGPDGMLEVRRGRGRTPMRHYVEGAYWPSGWHSPRFVNESSREACHLYNSAVLVTDLEIERPLDLARIMALARDRGFAGLTLVARTVAEPVLAMLLLNRDRADFGALAVKLPGAAVGQRDDLQDLAALVGARAVLSDAGMKLCSVTLEDLGQARHIWATRDQLGIVNGGADPQAARRYVRALRAQLGTAESPEIRGHILMRLGRALGGAAQIGVGGATDSEIVFKTQQAERTARLLRAGLRGGVVPGGGVTFLRCARAVVEHAAPGEAPPAWRALARALKAPAVSILTNSGYEPEPILAELETADSRTGFDVETGQMVDMMAVDILDAADVVRAALQTAVRTAALALTIETLVHTGG